MYPVENYPIHKGRYNNEVILGYWHLSIDEIEDGIKKVMKGIKIFTTEY